MWLFKVWDDKKSASKLTFKFQTPEEGKLCKDLISLFKLTNKGNTYTDVTSLKDARYAITGDFLERKGYPLWTLKYASEEAFRVSSPDTGIVLPTIKVTDEERKLIDNIVKICTVRDLRNPALVKETLNLIAEYRFEMKNILNTEAAFADGFKHFLMNLDFISIQEDDVEEVRQFVKANLQSSVGYWTEEEVEKKALQWNSARNNAAQASHGSSTPGMTSDNGDDTPSTPISVSTPTVMEQKRRLAKEHIAQLHTLSEAQALLNALCDMGEEWLLDKINQ